MHIFARSVSCSSVNVNVMRPAWARAGSSASVIPESLTVGDLVDATGAKAAAPGDIAYVVVEPAQADAKAFIVVSPEHTILALSGVEFGSQDQSLAQAQLATLGFTFADFSNVALRTT